jgi:hypothetical protein
VADALEDARVDDVAEALAEALAELEGLALAAAAAVIVEAVRAANPTAALWWPSDWALSAASPSAPGLSVLCASARTEPRAFVADAELRPVTRSPYSVAAMSWCEWVEAKDRIAQPRLDEVMLPAVA